MATASRARCASVIRSPGPAFRPRFVATRASWLTGAGRPTRVQTANGDVPGWRVSLGSARVGDVTVRDVDAIVVENESLPVALLGMSFLGRFPMQRQGPTLVLRRSH
jgi:clan AA aspartic protease (TIGR02281 family)